MLSLPARCLRLCPLRCLQASLVLPVRLLHVSLVLPVHLLHVRRWSHRLTLRARPLRRLDWSFGRAYFWSNVVAFNSALFVALERDYKHR
jgi:hypothetical protein